MLHGNPLLRGWWTSDVSFYTTELPEYALVVAARGLSPDVVHICGALTYTLTVALAGLLARGRATGEAGLRRAGIAVAIMLAPSILGGTEVFLENPDHFGTSVPVLLVLLLLDWGEGRDDVTGAALVRPGRGLRAARLEPRSATNCPWWRPRFRSAAVCAFRLAVTLVRRRPRAELRWDGLLVAAAAGLRRDRRDRRTGPAGARRLRPAADSRHPARLARADPRQRAAALWQSIVLLFGANNPGKPSRALTISQHIPLLLSADLHVIGLLWRGRAGRGPGRWPGSPPGAAVRPSRPCPARTAGQGWDRVVQILVVAIGVTIAAGLFSTVLQSLASAHEVAILLPLGAVLAGRRCRRRPGALVRAARPAAPSARDAVALPGGTVTTAATVALAGWLAVGVAEAGYARGLAGLPVAGAERRRLARRPPPARRPGRLLAGHRDHGRQRRPGPGGAGHRRGDRRQALGGVVGAGTSPADRATFVIAGSARSPAENALTVATARARFGRPAAEYHVGDDIVMIYRYNLLTRLHGRAFPGPS